MFITLPHTGRHVSVAISLKFVQQFAGRVSTIIRQEKPRRSFWAGWFLFFFPTHQGRVKAAIVGHIQLERMIKTAEGEKHGAKTELWL